MSKQYEALRLALEALEYYADMTEEPSTASGAAWIVREALADSVLDRMAENARELGLDYEPAQQPHCNDCGGFDPECPLEQPTQKETK